MAEEQKLSKSEIRKTIAASLTAAFGFVIALIWKEVVMGGLKVAQIDTTFDTIDLPSWLIFAVVSIVLTVAMVILIIVFSRWGSKA